MKKWAIIAAILVCCGLYAIVKFGLSRGQHANSRVEEARIEGPAEVNNSDSARLADVTRSAQQEPSSGKTGINEKRQQVIEDSGKAPQITSTSVSETLVEGITKAFTEFQSCIKDGEYETAWGFLANSMRSQYGDDFQKWKDGMSSGEARTVFLNLHPESVAESSEGFELKAKYENQTWRLYFIREAGQWKIREGQVDRSN